MGETIFSAVVSDRDEDATDLDWLDNKAVIAVGWKMSVVLLYTGHGIDVQLNEYGLTDAEDLGIGLDGADYGLWYWEGYWYGTSHETDCGTEYDEDVTTGVFRRLTDDEAKLAAAGIGPWETDDGQEDVCVSS